VRYGLRQLRVAAALDTELLFVLGNAHRARAARSRQRRLQHPSGEIDAVRRQLGDAVRDDRAREVDRLTAAAYECDLCHTSQNDLSGLPAGLDQACLSLHRMRGLALLTARSLHAGQLAQLAKRVRPRRRVDDLELPHALQTFSREQLDVISVGYGNHSA
jgi:hypothetical protein